MASLGRPCRGRSVKGASGGGCWKGAGSTLEEECWVVLGLISSSTRLQALDSKGAESKGADEQTSVVRPSMGSGDKTDQIGVNQRW